MKKEIQKVLKKPIIGIYADSFDNKVGQTVPYMEFFSMFGKVILITHDNYDVLENIYDILVVPGGADIIQDKLSFNTGRANPFYEFLDEKVLKPNLNKKPVIGVCRGFQAINKYMGGMLYPDIKDHNMSPRDSKHQILTIADEEFSENKEYAFINSIHHQAISVLGNGLKAIGFTAIKNNCKSLYNDNKPIKTTIFEKKDYDVYRLSENKKNVFIEVIEGDKILGFQYHPEEIYCPYAIFKINTFIYKYFYKNNE
jgi:putative glutamine amidotransferase